MLALQQRFPFDVETYDRLGVLAGEIKRLVHKGGPVVLCDSQNILDETRLKLWFCDGVPIHYD